MDGPVIAQLAARAGVDGAFVERLLGLGILDRQRPADEGAVRRVKLAQSLELGGISLETMAQAKAAGQFSLDFVDDPSYEVFAAYGAETFGEVARRLGLPVETLLAVRPSMGSAEGGADDRMRVDELQVVPYLEALAGVGVRSQAMERWLRVYGESLRRIADTESEMWRTEILEPLYRAGKTIPEIGEVVNRASVALSDRADRALLAIFHGQQAHAWMRNILEGYETRLEQAGLHARPERVPAICFLDLTGYTRLTEQQGDAAAAELAGRLATLVRQSSARHGGRPVKWLGDGVMFFFPEPRQAVLAALEMVAAAGAEGLPPAHVGVHAGPVLFQEGDFFGRTVNTASRVADHAQAGQVLVTQEVVDTAGEGPFAFADIGPVELKGLPLPIRLHLATRAPDRTA